MQLLLLLLPVASWQSGEAEAILPNFWPVRKFGSNNAIYVAKNPARGGI